MKKIIFLLLGTTLLCMSSVCSAVREPLRINCTIHSPYESFFFRLVRMACSENDIIVERNTPPVGRSLLHVNQGIDDGDGPRIGRLSAAYPNLIQVPEPFGDFVFGAFAKSKKPVIRDWASLKDLNVAYIHGWKLFDTKVTVARSITRVKNKNLLFRLLDANRTDVALMTKLSGYHAVKQLGLEKIRFIDPPLAVEPNYLYLHKSHAALVPGLTRVLEKMKKDGTYLKLYQEMISPYSAGE
jgi:polar amino acid transport system substrate-binding protein